MTHQELQAEIKNTEDRLETAEGMLKINLSAKLDGLRASQGFTSLEQESAGNFTKRLLDELL